MVSLFIVSKSLDLACQKSSVDDRLVWMKCEVEYLATTGNVRHRDQSGGAEEIVEN